MVSISTWTRACAAAAIVGMLTGCSGYRWYNQPESAAVPEPLGVAHYPFEEGDIIQVHTLDSAQIDGTLQEITDTGIIVSDQFVEYSQIEKVRVRETLVVPSLVSAAVGVLIGGYFLHPRAGLTPDS